MEILLKLGELLSSKHSIKVNKDRRSFVWNAETFEYMFSELVELKTKEMYIGNISIIYFDQENNPRRNITTVDALLDGAILNDGLQRLTSLQIILIALKRIILTNNLDEMKNSFNNMRVPFMKSSGIDELTFKELVETQDVSINNFNLINHEIINCYLFVKSKIDSLFLENGKQYLHELLINVSNIELKAIDFDVKKPNSELHKLHNVFSNENDFVSQYISFLYDFDIEARANMSETVEHNILEIDFEKIKFPTGTKDRNVFARTYFMEHADDMHGNDNTSIFNLFTLLCDHVSALISAQSNEIDKINLINYLALDFYRSAIIFSKIFSDSDSLISSEIVLRKELGFETSDVNDKNVNVSDLMYPILFLLGKGDNIHYETYSLVQIIYKLWVERFIYTDELLIFLEMLKTSLFRTKIFKLYNSSFSSFVEFKNWINHSIDIKSRVQKRINIMFHLQFIQKIEKYFNDHFLKLSSNFDDRKNKTVELKISNLLDTIVVDHLDYKVIKLILYYLRFGNVIPNRNNVSDILKKEVFAISKIRPLFTTNFDDGNESMNRSIDILPHYYLFNNIKQPYGILMHHNKSQVSEIDFIQSNLFLTKKEVMWFKENIISKTSQTNWEKMKVEDVMYKNRKKILLDALLISREKVNKIIFKNFMQVIKNGN